MCSGCSCVRQLLLSSVVTAKCKTLKPAIFLDIVGKRVRVPKWGWGCFQGKKQLLHSNPSGIPCYDYCGKCNLLVLSECLQHDRGLGLYTRNFLQSRGSLIIGTKGVRLEGDSREITNFYSFIYLVTIYCYLPREEHTSGIMFILQFLPSNSKF